MPVIPYKGGGPALTDLIGMHVAAMVEPMASAYPQVKGGRLRALAVTTPKRLQNLPDLPTVAESGFAGFDMPSWYGFWAPTGTPAEIIERLHTEIRAAMQAPAVTQKLAAMFFQAAVSTPSEFAAFTKRETELVKGIVAVAKIKLDE